MKKEYKIDTPDSPLPGDVKKKKNVRLIILKWTAVVLAVVLVIYLIFRGVGAFFDKYQLLFPRMVEVKLNWPVLVVDRKTLDPTLSVEEEIDRLLNSPENVEKLLKAISPTVTPTPTAKPKLRSSIVVPALATSGYTYPNYSNRKHYARIIEELKERFTNWEDAAELETKEGMFDPTIKNPTSGACGLPQALPCSKMKCSLDEAGIDCQLDWMKSYVADRYGTISKALSFRLANQYY